MHPSQAVGKTSDAAVDRQFHSIDRRIGVGLQKLGASVHLSENTELPTV